MQELSNDCTASPPDLQSVAQFRDWLYSSIRPSISARYRRWLGSKFKDDHRVVLTHGDFHPRNIMVVDQPDGNVSVSGIIDWEMAGWYPEYWELYKALNTRDIREEGDSDWWDILPAAILGYDREVVDYYLLERVVPG
ncbi:uncharacterized protein PHACADRAFT_264634 [Phanerochaete carnosa HHB-10118-sp]|uniref:Aminoglycoside phosphotransferase domain-containing protein n=1 Tax=Phanerochaete carnosa (strain HHB-10118-sp) TaxID=650164 RepID=K5VFY8_PHACS|nr:uncharacterized protein PHACADRAFT_264634 [Phanerochaete carnosa HHB-10118-sp]EKM50098.1 hypothetical protein PHACADRAFT_264634 [Phanerochaete carnosa HHB-10118-sp]